MKSPGRDYPDRPGVSPDSLTPAYLIGEETISEVMRGMQSDQLAHLFNFSIDTTAARSFWPDSDAYRRDTIMVYHAIGKALLVILELDEQTSVPYADGSQRAPESSWAARFIVGFPRGTDYQSIRNMGDITIGNVLGGCMRSADINLNNDCTASYSFQQLPEHRSHPLDPATLTNAALQLGGFENSTTVPKFWQAAKDGHFDAPAEYLASLVAPSSFQDADATLLNSPCIDRLARLVTASS